MADNELSKSMDAAAEEASIELAGLEDKAVMLIANWVKKWYQKAGHKRLSKILLDRTRVKMQEPADVE